MNVRLRSSLSTWSVTVVCLTAACYVAGRLGRLSVIPSGDVITLWSVSGIALGGLLCFGNRVWPALWFGSFLVQLTPMFEAGDADAAAKSLAIAATIGLGTVLQALAGRWMLYRVLGKIPTLDNVKEVLVFIGLGGLVSTTLGATVRAACLTWGAGGALRWAAWGASWYAEVNGVMVFAPLVLILCSTRIGALSWPHLLRLLESLTLFVILPFLVLWLADVRGANYGAIIVTASALWATLRFGKVGTALSLLTMALLLASNVKTGDALLGTIRVNTGTAARNAQTLQGAYTVTLWILAAILNERERAAKDLRESEARFRQFSEGMSHIIWMMTPDKKCFLYVNEAFERIFGRKREELYAASDVWLAGIHPEDRKRVANSRLVSESGQEQYEEFRVIHTDGTVRWLCERAVPLRNERGEISIFAGTAEDITQNRQVAEELARQQSELLHVSRLSSVGQMVAALSHEVAQPMGAIGTFVTVCAKALQSMPPEEAARLYTLKQCIEGIAAENRRCRAILRRLRNYSRKTPWHRAPCDLNTVLRESVDLILNELRRFDVKVDYELAHALPLVVADRIQLQQVVINLLTNARDAMLNVTPSRRLIVVRSALEENAVRIDVEDRGIGLPVHEANRLFEPFFTTSTVGFIVVG